MRKLKNKELKRLTTNEFKKANKLPLVVVLDNVRSMNNIGSVFRTSDAFLIEKIYLCGITAKPPHAEIHKTALGATESVDWVYYNKTDDAIEALKKEGYRVFSIEQAENSTMLNQFKCDPQERLAVVFGHEVRGVQQEIVDLSHGCIEIPQLGTKHSLNISVCAGVVLWEMFKQYRKLA